MLLLSSVHFQLLTSQAPFFFIVSTLAMKISEPQGSQIEGRREEKRGQLLHFQHKTKGLSNKTTTYEFKTSKIQFSTAEL